MVSSCSYYATPAPFGAERAGRLPVVLGLAVACTVTLLAVGTVALRTPDAPAAQQRYVAPVDMAYINTKTGTRLVLRPPVAPLRAAAGSPAEALESAAKVTVTGLLSVAAASTPANAVT
eukprot:EG_transcript_52427